MQLLHCSLLVLLTITTTTVIADGDGSSSELDGVNPKDGAALNSRALFYAERNEPARALPFFLQAIKNGPGVGGEYWNNLGVCYMRLKRWDDARVALSQAITLENSDAKRNLKDLNRYLDSIGHPKMPAQLTPKSKKAETPAPPPPPPPPVAQPKFLPKPVYKKPVGLVIRPRKAVPRFTVAELYAAGNERFAAGELPYILIDALSDWPARTKWTSQWFSQTFGDAIVDFYPHNMAKHDTHPYLTKMSDALIELEAPTPTGRYPFDPYNPGVYLQWNVNPDDWDVLLRDTPSLPYFFRRDEEWLTDCFKTPELRSEFTKRVHWRMVLIGSKGAGMFVHMDVLQSSSWQAQVMGAKKWFLCSPDQSTYMYGAGKVDVFNPDYASYPLFAQSDCYETVVTAGELVYYPANYWHQTENQAPLNVAFSSTISDDNNYLLVQNELKAECATKKFKWHFSPELCQSLEQYLYPWWQRRYDKTLDRGTCKLSEKPTHG